MYHHRYFFAFIKNKYFICFDRNTEIILVKLTVYIMDNKNGFQKYKRVLPNKESAENRINHFNEFYESPSAELTDNQSARCMDCGVPFCHSACPLGNLIPDFNQAVHDQNWKLAYDVLSSTNNFPEFTGRICPAPCEASCVLNVNSDPVTIEEIEKTIIEKAFLEGWVKPKENIKRNNLSVAVIGSGPAGMACAEQLNEKGYTIDLYEKNDRIGGLLRYGIPDFKLEKNIIDRRIEIMKASGISMHTGVNVGFDIRGDELREKYDAVVLAGGSSVPRNLPIHGRELKGIHYAMEYLEQNNRRVSGDTIDEQVVINVEGKNVIVIGGGDTGADCVGTSNRLRAKSVTQIELLSKPPSVRTENDLWPHWPMVLRTSTSHDEGCTRNWAVLTKRFVSEDGVNVSGIEIVDVEWKKDDKGKNKMVELPNSSRTLPCDAVFLAIGFLNPQKEGLLDQLGVELDIAGNVKANNYKTSEKNIFAAGDMRRGQSLVVWAIAEGREAAEAVDLQLEKEKIEEKQSYFFV